MKTPQMAPLKMFGQVVGDHVKGRTVAAQFFHFYRYVCVFAVE